MGEVRQRGDVAEHPLVVARRVWRSLSEDERRTRLERLRDQQRAAVEDDVRRLRLSR
ncbi:hypothetical protein [Nocardioides lianchengensis]|uniref:Uncharacterized protein n=1 Tax=Nocardioides lianchengensis TaxID=1045774 RepID=A0A1G6ZEF3_9ACTN|nr:hypothetical protein [Nocardioides lianchengensis]NYG11411.1 hypothetical protein [Nocardioides lianchengensis]SDE00994.1 hypothetical protein SAMN05421872_113114 [Nocardioides lianchengensis]